VVETRLQTKRSIAVKPVAATLANAPLKKRRRAMPAHHSKQGRANHGSDTGVLHTSKCCERDLNRFASAVARGDELPARRGARGRDAARH